MLSKGAIFCMALTNSLLVELMHRSVYKTFAQQGTFLACKCIDQNQLENAHRINLQTFEVIQQQLILEGVSREQAFDYITQPEQSKLLQVLVQAAGYNPIAISIEMREYQKSLVKESDIKNEPETITMNVKGQLIA